MNDLAAFRELGISESMLQTLHRKGFEEPTPIQRLAIPRLLGGNGDLIGQARTGTGKTAAFGIPILERCTAEGKLPKALILAPTRELAMQISEELNSLKGTSKLRIAPFYGGQNIEIQLQRLRDGVDVVIGTPGRLLDLMSRGKLRWDDLRYAVLDEADEMLNLGFIEDIETILGALPEERQVMMFSATMPPAIRAIAERFMTNPELLSTVSEEADTSSTEQVYFEVRREDKTEALVRLLEIEEDLYAMVFCRTRNDVDELTEKLQSLGYPAEALHGDIAQASRTRVIGRFKTRKFRILVATDVAARGIDVNDLTHVINYSMPQGTEAYVHRIGRTGRAGKSGMAITFVTPAEYRHLHRLRQELRGDIREEILPRGEDMVELKKNRCIERLEQLVAEGRHEPYMDFASELLHTQEPTPLLAAILRLAFRNEFMAESYRNIGPGPRSNGPRGNGPRGPRPGGSRGPRPGAPRREGGSFHSGAKFKKSPKKA